MEASWFLLLSHLIKLKGWYLAASGKGVRPLQPKAQSAFVSATVGLVHSQMLSECLNKDVSDGSLTRLSIFLSWMENLEETSSKWDVTGVVLSSGWDTEHWKFSGREMAKQICQAIYQKQIFLQHFASLNKVPTDIHLQFGYTPWNVWRTVSFMLLIVWGFLEVWCGIRCGAAWLSRTRAGWMASPPAPSL